jgi:hypothetical protein
VKKTMLGINDLRVLAKLARYPERRAFIGPDCSNFTPIIIYDNNPTTSGAYST